MKECRVWAQLTNLVESGQLLAVVPAIPSADIFAKADARKLAVCGKPLHPWTCEINARCLVEAMLADEGGWAVVGGFAIGPTPTYPVRHVWARKDQAHFDPTWSRATGIVSLADFRYFALPGIFPSSEGLEYLTAQAATLGIDLLEDRQWDKPVADEERS